MQIVVSGVNLTLRSTPAIVPVLREKQVTVTLELARAGAAPKRRDGEA